LHISKKRKKRKINSCNTLGFVQLGDEVDYSKQNTALFDEQKRKIAYFLKVLRGLDGTSLVLVYCFCKIGCPKYKTRVVL
jgi:hypothetical protein